MSSRIPWSELSDRERENFRSLLHDHGIRVTVNEAREYYGNREKIEREATEPLDNDDDGLCSNCMGPITQESLLLEGEPGFCPHCGVDLAEGDRDPAELIETVEVRLTPGQHSAVVTGADLTDATPEEFCRDAIRSRVQALEKVIREQGDQL